MKNNLTVLWTTADLVTIEKMIFMYTLNSKIHGWFDEVTLVIWGASAGLLAENKALQERIDELLAAGVRVEACKACADQLEVTPILERCRVNVKYWGQELSEVLRSGDPLITV